MTTLDQPGEQWRPVPGRPGYEASDRGRVLSRRKTGTARVLTATPGPCGFRTLQMSALVPGGQTQRVGVLVALAFIGPPPSPDAELRRRNGNPMDDRLENLAWGTAAEVAADHAARARRDEAAGAPTHCPHGHVYADSWLGNWGQRLCPTCRVEGRTYRTVVTACMDCGTAVEQVVHGSRSWKKRCPECKAAATRAAQHRYSAQAERAPRVTACTDCGMALEGGRPRRCPTCKKIASREIRLRYWQRKLGVAEDGPVAAS